MSRSQQLLALLGLLSLAGCATTTPTNIAGAGTQLKAMTLRSVIATLQDLGFTIDQADAELGTVTATRLHDYTMRMTVTVVKKEGNRISVRERSYGRCHVSGFLCGTRQSDVPDTAQGGLTLADCPTDVYNDWHMSTP